MKHVNWGFCIRRQIWELIAKMILSHQVDIIQEFRHLQVIQLIILATAIMLEVSQVKTFSSINLWKIMAIFFTDVEIQKIRQDKINPAYSPEQSEHESPSKLNGNDNKEAFLNFLMKTICEKSTKGGKA